MVEEKILVIDAEESSCRLVQSALSTRGYEVSVAQTAKLGLTLHREQACGLIFVDLNLEDLDAQDVVREIKRRDESAAVIISGYPDNNAGLVSCALNLGAADFFYKPFRPQEIYFRVKQSLEFRKSVLNHSRTLKSIEEKNSVLMKQNLLLARRIEESTKNISKLYEGLRETYMRTIKALAHAIDARDHYTSSHSDNVARYAELIARKMDVDMRYIEDLKDACQLHDLGKIGVHDNILGKPGVLTKEEFDEIKLHSQKGAKILEPLKFLENVSIIVRHHHERWDGGGYPDGLRGNQIPLGARIMSVADSFDAMVSARPYRRVGLSRQEALAEIKKNSGAQFDPKVVEVFLKVVEQF